MAQPIATRPATTNPGYAIALSRAFAGSTIFAMPLLMTMEMWWLGFYLPPWLLLQFVLANIGLLYGLSKIAGFEESYSWLDDILDAFAAYAVAFVTASVLLALFDVIRPDMPLSEISGKIAIQAVPASFGAMIGAKMLGAGKAIKDQERWRDTFAGGLFVTLAGALFLSLTVSPTEEMILIAYQMTPQQALLLLLLSVILLHAILYVVGFPKQDRRVDHNHGLALIRRTVPAYAIALCASYYVLWTFGRMEGLSLGHEAMTTVVLGLPASIGAGIARVAV